MKRDFEKKKTKRKLPFQATGGNERKNISFEFETKLNPKRSEIQRTKTKKVKPKKKKKKKNLPTEGGALNSQCVWAVSVLLWFSERVLSELCSIYGEKVEHLGQKGANNAH